MLQHHGALTSHCLKITVPQHHSSSTSHCLNTTLPQHHSSSTSQFHNITVPQHHSASTSQYLNLQYLKITVPQPPQYLNVTVSQDLQASALGVPKSYRCLPLLIKKTLLFKKKKIGRRLQQVLSVQGTRLLSRPFEDLQTSCLGAGRHHL